MKYIKALIFFTVTISVSGQELKIEEPEFAGIFLYVNDSVGTGLKLEQQLSSIATKTSGTAYIPFANAKTASKSIVKGCCSPIKIPKDGRMRFIISVKDNTVDPSTIINVFRLKTEKETRVVEIASVTRYGGATANAIEFLPFTGKKYGKSSYLIELTNVEPGEYAMTLPERRELFNLFSVF